ncbi:MAG TPA: penicillin acylase family protein [Candidatus Hydrogenedentes bacterium]|nr:penicillin acylase family protein [Candidatus Hydrogenedentota bacterium]
MKWIKTFFKWVVLPVVILVVLGGGGATLWLGHIAKTHQPHLDGIIKHPLLKSEVRVVRDNWHVPHITAQNEPDAYFALGYVMAQDRLFQMELWRRLASGELAEILGPLAVPVDKIVRSFRLRALAENYVTTQADALPELKAAAEAYIAGINYCMASEPLPFEYVALQIPARPFTLADCLVVAAILPITFAEGLREDLLCSMLKEKYPDKDIDALFPGYSKEIPVTIMENLEEAKAYVEAHPQSPQVSSAQHQETLKALQACLEPLKTISEWISPTFGSNSWVLAPARTKSGKPILANDPHIGFTNPSVWFEAHLKFGEVENYGFHLPLIPFPLLAHNMNRAWGITMFENDDTDLYLETFDPLNPHRVKYKGEWVDVKTEKERIKVRFWKDQEIEVRITPHGPVITDVFRLLHGYTGADISLRWIWQHTDYTDMQALYKMSHAQDLASFGKAVSLVTSPGLNISYADREGNIAWWAAGLIPIRPPHINPKQLLDGASGKDEIEGYVPFEQNPQLVNPPWGYIVTANNMSTVKPVGPVQQLQGYWQPSERAARIEYLLEQHPQWTIHELCSVQFDDAMLSAPPVLFQMVQALGDTQNLLTSFEQQALDALKSWNFKHDVDSCGASIFHEFCEFILEGALLDEMGPKLYKNYLGLADHANFFKAFIGDNASPFWDDISTSSRETRHDIVLDAFKKTTAHLKKELGGDIKQWRWGLIHTMTFTHPFGYLPLLGKLFNVGPFESTGAADVINNMLYIDGSHNFSVVAGPSTRRLIDYADTEHSLAVLPTGNSGNFMSPSYGDQAPLFMNGQYREPRFTAEQIEANKRHEIRFSPQP